MKISTLLFAFIPVACLVLALSVDALIESRLFLSLSIITGSLFLRHASKSEADVKQEKKESPSYDYTAQEYQVQDQVYH